MTTALLADIIDCPSVEILAAQYSAQKNHALQELCNDWMYSLKEIPAQEKPMLFHTLGFPGSGKSTLLEYCHEHEKLFPENSFFLGFDRIMESCEAYQNDHAEFGSEEAFNRWEIPARALGYELLQEALRRKIHIVFEHSGARKDHVDMLRTAKEYYGYEIVMLDVVCDVEKAVQRMTARVRFLPTNYVSDRKKAIDELRPLYSGVADLWYEYDTAVFPPKRIK